MNLIVGATGLVGGESAGSSQDEEPSEPWCGMHPIPSTSRT